MSHIERISMLHDANASVTFAVHGDELFIVAADGNEIAHTMIVDFAECLAALERLDSENRADLRLEPPDHDGNIRTRWAAS